MPLAESLEKKSRENDTIIDQTLRTLLNTEIKTWKVDSIGIIVIHTIERITTF